MQWKGSNNMVDSSASHMNNEWEAHHKPQEAPAGAKRANHDPRGFQETDDELQETPLYSEVTLSNFKFEPPFVI